MISESTSNALIEHRHASHCQSLAVVLPAYNEERIIAYTILTISHALDRWQRAYEILVVNDGSVDQTGAIVAELAAQHPEIHLINHTTNQGYGAALVSGFEAASKDLIFFMDSDGQFDIEDLDDFFPSIDDNDAIIGYRIDRQDSWMRQLNAWGWKGLLGRVLHIHIRDVDCAFKLIHADFLHKHPLKTRGAMINAELVYRLKQAGGRYREVGVSHYPRQGGQATGAKLSVILRALRELFVFAQACQREEQMHNASGEKRGLPTKNCALNTLSYEATPKAHRTK